MERQKVKIENEIRKFANPAGKIEEKAVRTNSIPDKPFDNTPVDKIAKEVIVHITNVSMKTSKAPQRPT